MRGERFNYLHRLRTNGSASIGGGGGGRSSSDSFEEESLSAVSSPAGNMHLRVYRFNNRHNLSALLSFTAVAFNMASSLMVELYPCVDVA